MALLVGDATEYPGPAGGGLKSEAFDGVAEVYKFTAVESGTIGTLSAWVLGESTYTTLDLCVYADASGIPGDLLGYGAAPNPGEADGVSAWVAAGVSIPVVEGTDYWVGWQPHGGDVWYNLGEGSYLATVSPDTAGTPASIWPYDADFDFNGVIPGLTGTGDVFVPPASGLVWHITGLWYPDAETVDYYGMVADPLDGEVVIPLNDSRTASVTVSLHDAIVGDVIGHTYARCLKVYYRDHLVFWGPVKLTEVDLTGDDERGPTVRLSAVDPSLRMVRHYVRRGDTLSDGVLSEANDDKGTVSIDHVGLRLLRDCANNIPEQTTRGVPDLGVIDGSNDFPAADAEDVMGITRGDEVFNAMRELSQSLGPDFELHPIETTVGAYAQLNTYIVQGSDKTATVKWHYATGLDNLEGLSFTEGSQYVTHAHVLDRTNRYRFTELNLASSAETGQYTYWDATDYDATGVTAAGIEAVLRGYGRDIIAAYGNPLVVVALQLPVETGAENELHYLDHYVVGDIVEVAGRTGRVQLAAGEHRITEVRLVQSGPENSVAPQVTVVPNAVITVDDTDTEG